MSDYQKLTVGQKLYQAKWNEHQKCARIDVWTVTGVGPKQLKLDGPYGASVFRNGKVPPAYPTREEAYQHLIEAVEAERQGAQEALNAAVDTLVFLRANHETLGYATEWDRAEIIRQNAKKRLTVTPEML